jgi:hypothetical protein
LPIQWTDAVRFILTTDAPDKKLVLITAYLTLRLKDRAGQFQAVTEGHSEMPKFFNGCLSGLNSFSFAHSQMNKNRRHGRNQESARQFEARTEDRILELERMNAFLEAEV